MNTLVVILLQILIVSSQKIIVKGDHTGIDICGETSDINESEVRLISPGYPNIKYPLNLDCERTIHFGETTAFRVEFNSNFEIGPPTYNGVCPVGFIEIRNNDDADSPSTMKVCGTTKPPTATFLGMSVRIRFKSDSRKNGKGFALNITQIPRSEHMEVDSRIDGKSVANSIAAISTKIFHDDTKWISSMSKELRGSNLLLLGWNDETPKSVNVSCSLDCVVVVMIWELDGRQDTLTDILQSQGWTLKNDLLVSWEMIGDAKGKTKSVLSSRVPASQIFEFNTPDNALPISIFVVQEKCSQMHCEYKNTDGKLDGIMCGKGGDYCSSDQWCNGEWEEKRSFWTIDTSKDDSACYSKDDITCGNEIISPGCNFCPNSNYTGIEDWCGGICKIDKENEMCQNKYNYEKFIEVHCIQTDREHETLYEAKKDCSSDTECIGVLDSQCNRDFVGKPYYTCTNTVVDGNLFDAYTSCVYRKYEVDDEICFDVKMSTVQYGSDAEWHLGTCNSTGIQYERYSNYVHRCCLAPGQYTLTCINKSRPYGWDEGFVEIQESSDESTKDLTTAPTSSTEDKDTTFKNITGAICAGDTQKDWNDEFDAQFSQENFANCQTYCKTKDVCTGFTFNPKSKKRICFWKADSPIKSITNNYLQKSGQICILKVLPNITSDEKNNTLLDAEFTKLTGKVCNMYSIYEEHSRLYDAKEACLYDDQCNGISDSSCFSEDQKSIFRLCYESYEYIDRADSCVYKKADNVVAYEPANGCPTGTYGCKSIGEEKGCPNTCFCEDHCSWKKCKLKYPPHDCLLASHKWDINKRNGYWETTLKENNSIPVTTTKREPATAKHKVDANHHRSKYQKENKKIEVIGEVKKALNIALLVSFGVFCFCALGYSPKKILENPKNLLHRLKAIFTFACFILALQFAITQVIRFIENKNMSSISFKKFNDKPDNKYPSFSICLKGREIYWKIEPHLFEHTGVTSGQYVDLLKGKGWRYEYDYMNGSYEKTYVNESDIHTFGIAHSFLSPSDIIIGTHFFTRNGLHDKHYGYGDEVENLREIPFQIGHQAADEICFTRDSSDEPGLIRMRDQVLLNRLLLRPGNHLNLEVRIFLHHPTQLVEQLENPTLRFKLKDQSRNHIFKQEILQVSVLKSRPDANTPCYDGDLGDDSRYRQEIVKTIGCMPIYWKNLDVDTIQKNICESNQEYDKLNKMITSYEEVSSTYPRSCISMETLLTKSLDQGPETQKHIEIEVSYPNQDTYQETENVRELVFESFFANLGGFIGIFLGYSILQIPELINNVMAMVKRSKIIKMIG